MGRHLFNRKKTSIMNGSYFLHIDFMEFYILFEQAAVTYSNKEIYVFPLMQ